MSQTGDLPRVGQRQHLHLPVPRLRLVNVPIPHTTLKKIRQSPPAPV
jgi:hypothetical protein